MEDHQQRCNTHGPRQPVPTTFRTTTRGRWRFCFILDVAREDNGYLTPANVESVSNCVAVMVKDFLYGFSPERSQHDALAQRIERKKVNWLLVLDIRQFFDTVEYD